jgi:hypothetical protein
MRTELHTQTIEPTYLIQRSLNRYMIIVNYNSGT